MAKNTGTLVTDTIKTFDDTDKYAVVNSSDIKGGHHVVDYDTDRNNLVSNYPLRTETGMLVTVRSSSERGDQMTTYQLSGSSWINYADYLTTISNIWTSGGTGNIWYAPPSGNVGIGLTGANITGKLSVFGQSHFYHISPYRITIDPTNASIFVYDTDFSTLGVMKLGNTASNLGITIRPDDNNKVGINNDSPTTTLDVSGKTTIREQLIIDYSATGGVGTWNKSGILIKNNNVTPSEVAVVYQNISTGSNYWFTGLNESSIYQVIYGTTYAGNSFLEINTSGLVTINNSLTVNNSININTGTTLSDGVFNVGSTSRAANSVIRVISNDSYISGFEAYGSINGTGYLYIGKSSTIGGGILFNGDDNPAAIDPINSVLFYRRSASNATVFYYAYNSNNVFFNGSLYCGGNLFFNADATGFLTHNIAQENINIRPGGSIDGIIAEGILEDGTPSGLLNLYTVNGGNGGIDTGLNPGFGGTGGNGGNSGSISINTGDGGDSGTLNYYYGGTAGNSGSIYIYSGNPGNDGHGTGYYGAVVLQHSGTARGNVLIGTNINTGSRLKVNGVGEANDWVATSDIREKENITDFKDALDKVKKLNAVYFNFKNDEDKNKKIGLIAQEVEKIIPELVPQTINENSIKSVSYMYLSAVLVKAVQEQNIMIENLIDEINNIKTKINNK
jgi:hypothetical protein